ncbi:MAG TPA: chemotaxis protein CheW, partial [Duganella sp.]|nr:chemotaxis protein CheW [Duganella sp.]
MHTPEQKTNAGAGPTELFGSFVLGPDEFALPAHCIREVVNYPDKMTGLPLSPPFLEGMFTLRGSVIPVVNLGRVFNPAAPAADPSHKIAILDYDGVLAGILFHATGEILRVRPEQRSTLSYASGERHGVVAGTILLDDGARLLQILDPAALARI